MDNNGTERGPDDRVPWIRCTIGGLLMGLAMLVPGVSGGTMILIMGLYDEFITALADVFRLKITLRNLLLLGVIAFVAGLTILLLAKSLASLVLLQPFAMYSLFIGMTIGGVPMLWRMMSPMASSSAMTFTAGILVMLAIATFAPEKSSTDKAKKEKIRAMVKAGDFPLDPNYTLDVAAGFLGMSAMVLPGISGAYMLLLLGRYEQILGAIASAKEVVFSLGEQGDPRALQIIIPVALGMIISLITVTNLLKWLLHNHKRQTIGFLLGVLLGSVVMLFTLLEFQIGRDVAKAAALLPIGFVVTVALERMGDRSNARQKQHPATTQSN